MQILGYKIEKRLEKRLAKESYGSISSNEVQVEKKVFWAVLSSVCCVKFFFQEVYTIEDGKIVSSNKIIVELVEKFDSNVDFMVNEIEDLDDIYPNQNIDELNCKAFSFSKQKGGEIHEVFFTQSKNSEYKDVTYILSNSDDLRAYQLALMKKNNPNIRVFDFTNTGRNFSMPHFINAEVLLFYGKDSRYFPLAEQALKLKSKITIIELS